VFGPEGSSKYYFPRISKTWGKWVNLSPEEPVIKWFAGYIPQRVHSKRIHVQRHSSVSILGLHFSVTMVSLWRQMFFKQRILLLNVLWIQSNRWEILPNIGLRDRPISKCVGQISSNLGCGLSGPSSHPGMGLWVLGKELYIIHLAFHLGVQMPFRWEFYGYKPVDWLSSHLGRWNTWQCRNLSMLLVGNR